MKVLDTHLHLWDPSVLRYDWLIDVPALHRPFAARALAEATADVPTDVSLKYIFMQAGAADEQALAEVDWVSGLAEHLPIAGVIAFAQVELGVAVGPHLDALRERPLVRGVRRMTQDEAPGFGVSDAFVAGARAVASAGLTFDACVRSHLLGDVAALARAVPGLPIMLDHLGKPPLEGPGGAPGEGFARWQMSLQQCAAEPNVWVKLSGLPGETTPDWTPEGLTPFMDAALSAFGPERCVFGSDWPASSPSSDYARWLAFVRTWLEARVDPATAERVLWHNAMEFYGV